MVFYINMLQILSARFRLLRICTWQIITAIDEDKQSVSFHLGSDREISTNYRIKTFFKVVKHSASLMFDNLDILSLR